MHTGNIYGAKPIPAQRGDGHVDVLFALPVFWKRDQAYIFLFTHPFFFQSFFILFILERLLIVDIYWKQY